MCGINFLFHNKKFSLVVGEGKRKPYGINGVPNLDQRAGSVVQFLSLMG